MKMAMNGLSDPDDVLASLVKHFRKEGGKKNGRAWAAEVKETFKSSDDRGTRFGRSGDAGSFEVDGTEYNWIASDEEADRIAIAQVKDDLETQPEVFEQNWLGSHFDEERWFRDIASDEENMIREKPKSYIRDDPEDVKYSDSQILEAAEAYVEEHPEMALEDARIMFEENSTDKDFFEDHGFWEDPDEAEYSDDQIETALKDHLDNMRPVMEYLTKELGYEGEALANLLSSYLDIDSAAEEAVSTDGWAHFLSHYDGNYDETAEGVVYFRE